jgi:hypothetical protein
MRVAALVRASAAIAAFPPAHARAVRNERARVSLQAFACMSAQVRSLASGRRARPLLQPAPPGFHAHCARAGRVERHVSGRHVRANQSAPANPTLSLALPSSHSAGHRCPAHPSDTVNPAEPLPVTGLFQLGAVRARTEAPNGKGRGSLGREP